MLSTLTVTKVISGAAISDNTKIYILGNNQALTLTQSSAGGGKYTLSGTPMPDPMRVINFAATVSDSTSRPYRGIRLALGALTGLPTDPVIWLHEGVTGDRGFIWVRVPFQFRTGFGLVMQFPYYAPSATYYLKGAVFYEPS